MDLADPQQWSAYVYSDNTPITSSDPSGMLGSASCAPGEVGGQGACTGTENSRPSGGGGTGIGGGNGNAGGNSGGGGNSRSGKPSGNVAQAVPAVQQKEKCGWFAPVCNGWQRSMDWVHENQDTLGHIAIDLIEIDAGASLITGGATLAAGGGILEVGSGGILTVIAVPAAAVGVTGVAAGGGLVAHGSWNLGKTSAICAGTTRRPATEDLRPVRPRAR
jgi:hypothetical protein